MTLKLPEPYVLAARMDGAKATCWAVVEQGMPSNLRASLEALEAANPARAASFLNILRTFFELGFEAGGEWTTDYIKELLDQSEELDAQTP